MGKSRMDNSWTLAPSDTQDIRRRQANHKKHNTTQKTKKMRNTDPTKNTVGANEGYSSCYC